MHLVRREDSRAACTAGNSRATSTPMIATTTSNSTRVKPRRESGDGCMIDTITVSQTGSRPIIGRLPDNAQSNPGTAGGGMTFGRHQEQGESVRVVSAQDIQEKLDGKMAGVTVVEVTIGPGQAGVPHRHPGPGFVYVLEGEYELGIDDRPTKVFKAGETFYEPTGCLHRVSKNPSSTGKTRLIAFVLHPRDAKEVAIPEPAKE